MGERHVRRVRSPLGWVVLRDGVGRWAGEFGWVGFRWDLPVRCCRGSIRVVRGDALCLLIVAIIYDDPFAMHDTST